MPVDSDLRAYQTSTVIGSSTFFVGLARVLAAAVIKDFLPGLPRVLGPLRGKGPSFLQQARRPVTHTFRIRST